MSRGRRFLLFLKHNLKLILSFSAACYLLRWLLRRSWWISRKAWSAVLWCSLWENHEVLHREHTYTYPIMQFCSNGGQHVEKGRKTHSFCWISGAYCHNMVQYLSWMWRACKKYLFNIETIVLILFLFLAYQYIVHGESLRTLLRKAKDRVGAVIPCILYSILFPDRFNIIFHKSAGSGGH